MLAPPSWHQRSRELLVGRDLLRLVLAGPQRSALPDGDGQPVLVVTGFGGTDRSLAPLRRFLRRLGHDPRPASLGRVSDDVEALFPEIGRRSEQIAEATGRRVALIGWSIGGVLSREAARDHAHAIDRVITFGTPVEGGPSYTSLAWRYTETQLAAIRSRIEERSQTPISVPVTAIWSRNDGVVTPEACIDRRTPGVEHVEVSSTHVGMGFDPDVWATIATRLTPANQTQGAQR